MQNPKLQKKVLKNGTTVWWARYRKADGTQGKFTHPGTKDEAQVELTRLVQEEHDIKHGIVQKVEKGATMHSLGDRYYKYCLDSKSANTAEKAKSSFRALNTYKGDILLALITSGFCDDYKAFRLRSGKAPATVRSEIGTLKVAWNQAVKWGMCRTNPWNDVQVKVDPKVPEYLKAEEVARLLEHIKDSDLLPLVKFYLYSAARRNEAIFLKWNQVDLEAQKLTFTHTKTGRPRTLFYSQIPQLDELLKSLPQDSEWVFPRRNTARKIREGEPYAPDNVSHRVRTYLDELGIGSKISVHSFRKTMASNSLLAGTALFQVSQILGHRQIQTTIDQYIGIVPHWGDLTLAKLPY